MSFNLPRNNRDLRFTGALRALGAPRPRGGADDARTPYLGARPSARAEHARQPMPSFSDEEPTLAFDRDELGPAAPPPRAPASRIPIPNFRSAEQIEELAGTRLTPTAPSRHRRGLPLAVWLLGAILVGIVSYRFAPQAAEAVGGIDTAAHALDAL